MRDFQDCVDEEIYVARRVSGVNYEEMRWTELDRIELFADGEGAHTVCLVLTSNSCNKSMTIAMGDPIFEAVMERVEGLPEFEYRLVIKALAATRKRIFEIWRR